MPKSLAGRLERLEAARLDYGPGAAKRTERLLASFAKLRFPAPESLIRFHDALLFLRAFPQSARVARMAEKLLSQIEQEVVRLLASGADIEAFDAERVSGIAGTTIREEHTYEVARWLAQRYPEQITAQWDVEEQYGKLVNALPRFLPLLEDDSFVEPDIAFKDWMAAAAGGPGREWLWLMRQFETLPYSLKDKTELYDALGLVLDFDLTKSPASRTYARRQVKTLFTHSAPLLQRKHVSLAGELSSPDIPLEQLSPSQAVRLLAQAREALTVRHRELYGTTRADASHVYRADIGRGLEIFLWGLPPDRRLPLRAYHAACTYKNGVPINYLEAISLFDWTEVGFNTFYTYRDGETAWIYSKVLHLLHQLTGVTCVSVYPYQIGYENEEAIQSGAFWFYRKLGFRPGKPDLLAITEREERKMARNPKHRTSAATLRKLATGHIFYEFGGAPRGLYDTFRVRNIGLAVQRRMATKYHGRLQAMCADRMASLAATLNVNLESSNALECEALSHFAYALTLVPEVANWSEDEKQGLAQIIRAKAGREEKDYLRLLQRHETLKRSMVELGSASPAHGKQTALE
jgi:hypothetical protein